MKNTLLRKILVIGSIVLFIGLAFIPSFNAVSISKDIESINTRTIHVDCICEEYWGTLGYIVKNAIVTLRSNDGLLYRVQIAVFGGCNFLCIPTYYNENNLNVDAKHMFNDYRVDYIKWINDNNIEINFWVNWNKPKDDNILENIPKVNPMNQDISVSEEDCIECQSNGKAHLAEKLLNRLEKNYVLSNEIKSNNLDDDRPICKLLNKTYQKYHDLFVYLFELRNNLPEGSKLREIYALGIATIMNVVIGTILYIAFRFNCF